MNVRDYLEVERERLLLFVPVILGLGILSGVFFPFGSFSNLLAFLLGVGLVVTLLYKKFKLIAVCCFIFSLGIYVSQTGGLFSLEFLPQKQFIEKEYDRIGFKARVKFIDETHPTMKNMRRVVFNDVSFKHNPELTFLKTIKMTCSAKASESISPNDIVDVFGKISPFKNAAIPGSFDQLQYNALVGIDATGIVYKIRKVGSETSYLNCFSYLRRMLTKNIVTNLKGSSGGIASALLTGDKSSVPTAVRESYINSGTAHILAISGLHMSIVATIVYFVFLKLFQYLSCFWNRINSRNSAALATIPITFLYLGLSGFSPSAIRAFIMTLCFLISVIFGRKVFSLRTVSIAAFLILLFDSASLFLVSFQLSFSAVVALISFYEAFQARISRLRSRCNSIFSRIYFYLFASSLTTIIASLATSPISIATFNRLNCSGLIGNLIAIPVMSFLVVPVGLLALITGSFSRFFISALEIILNALTEVLELVSSLPGSCITVKSPNFATLSLIVCSGIILCLLKTKLRNIGWVGMLFGIALWGFEKRPDVVYLPRSEVVCFVEDNKFYSTSLQKARPSVLSIQRNLGFDGKLLKKSFSGGSFEKSETELFIWSDSKTTRTLAPRRHPYCPATFY